MLEELIITTGSMVSDPGLRTFISSKQSKNKSNKLTHVDIRDVQSWAHLASRISHFAFDGICHDTIQVPLGFS